MMNFLRYLTLSTACAAVLLLCGISGLAQDSQKDKAAKPGPDVVVEENRIIIGGPEGPDRLPIPPPAPGTPGLTWNFVSSEMSFDRKIVKGAPYSADAVTETVQSLSDGNRIVRKSAAKIYRDSEGRTRREQTLSAIGPFATAGDPPQVILINDPVTGVNYSLDPRSHTARKFMIRTAQGNPRAPLPPAPPSGTSVEIVRSGPAAGAAPEGKPRVMIFQNGPGEDMNFRVAPGAKQLPKPVTESLGKQTIEGVEAEGTRSTVTIPAGEIGNERPIEIVSERWYSPELQTVVMTKHNDPLVGETTYRLTNINRSEPAHSLFEVPGDYKIREGAPMFEFRTTVGKPGDNK